MHSPDSRQYFRFGLGYGPLRRATPPEIYDQVDIGDVGYLKQGRFYRLFSATKEAGLNRVPRDFERFDAGPVYGRPLRQRDDRNP